jgi:septal ring factor EnvC (AmiA/AmiB activator)
MFGNIGKRLFWVLLAVVLLIVVGVLVMHIKRQETVFRQAIKQQEQIIKQKDEQIQQLQEQLESLRKEQVLRERKVIVLKKQRMQIQKPRNVEEIVRKFKDLGYEAQIR